MVQGRFVIVWLTWLFGGICGVIVLLVAICYCHTTRMPRHQKSLDGKVLLPDEQYLKESHSFKESHRHHHHGHGTYTVKIVEKPPPRQSRPASYAGVVERAPPRPPPRAPPRPPERPPKPERRDDDHHYASSSMLDELDHTATSEAALKTRSLPAFLKKQRPLSSEDDIQQLYAKVVVQRQFARRMRGSLAAAIALGKARAQTAPHTPHAPLTAAPDAVIVYDQRTAF